jgi:hypothetical protein
VTSKLFNKKITTRQEAIKIGGQGPVCESCLQDGPLALIKPFGNALSMVFEHRR